MPSLEESPLAQRSSSSTGFDLVLEPLGDLVITSTGDLAVQSGQESIKESLLRRLQTPINGYSRWIQTVNGLINFNEGYGNALYSYLSSPLSEVTLRGVKESAKLAASQDPRIVVSEIEVRKTSGTSVSLELMYYLKGEDKLRKIVADLSSNVQT